jgi:mono/diheme cytochrome c family protein
VGRFGWKAQIATVLSFSGDAARTEMGLTNRVVPDETAPNGDNALLGQCDPILGIEDQPDARGLTFVDAVTAFQRYLGPPPQSPRSGMAGEAIFNSVGCVKCHTAQFLTPNDPALEGAIRNKAIRVYSDFLLHDMGALADGIPDGQATGVEMKTPPLWNLRTRPVMLHNGSVSAGDFATKVTAAINAHAGEAAASRTAFLALTTAQRAQVVAFLDSLGRNDYDTDSDGLITRLDFALIVRNSTDANVTADEAWAVADLNQNHLIDADEVTQLRDMLGVPVDCNQNGVADWTEIATGATDDLNGNGTPDECDQ